MVPGASASLEAIDAAHTTCDPAGKSAVDPSGPTSTTRRGKASPATASRGPPDAVTIANCDEDEPLEGPEAPDEVAVPPHAAATPPTTNALEMDPRIRMVSLVVRFTGRRCNRTEGRPTARCRCRAE